MWLQVESKWWFWYVGVLLLGIKLWGDGERPDI